MSLPRWGNRHSFLGSLGARNWPPSRATRRPQWESELIMPSCVCRSGQTET
jgi:hypothetical protein